ncbi:MAG TPA: FMN-binding protein [Candidatus Paceibacterota bacterium]|nr:FMN-binding protein [Candidatus Paceibacterota bacterium]
MKKLFLSIFVIAASAGYSLYQNLGGGSSVVTTPSSSSPTTTVTSPSSITVENTPPPTQTPTPIPTPAPTPTPTPTPAPAPKPQGQYADGTYTGSPANAYYGTVQVQAVVSGGKLASVSFLQYPNDRSTSRYINSQAMPYLIQEAISAQSANVNTVSGASDTSGAFRESLGSALAQAKN